MVDRCGCLALGVSVLSIATGGRAQTLDASPSPTSASPAPTEIAVTVHGTLVRDRTTSEYLLPVPAFATVARSNAGDAVALTPGVWVSQDNGEGHAQQVYLRGFFGDDGSDVAFSLDGVPLNQVGNLEHHGLVSLTGIIPELIQRVDATVGIADPRQGDFAVAGSVDLRLGLRDRGTTVRATVGSDGSERGVFLWAPRGANEQTVAGAEAAHGDGFGPARAFDHASAVWQQVFAVSPRINVRVLILASVGQYRAPGLVRDDDVAARRIDFFGTYPINATGLGGRQRGFLTSATVEWHAPFQRAEARLFGMLRDSVLTEDFTGYLVHPSAGDRIHYGYTGGTVGFSGLYRRSAVVAERSHDFEAGYNARYDRYASSLQSVDAVGQPLMPPDAGDVVADSNLVSLGSYADLVVRPLSWLTLRGGGRADVGVYDAWVTRSLSPARVTASGIRAGPKATLDVHLGRGFSVIGSYGSGFRSPDVSAVTSGQLAFASVSGQDVGVRYSLPGGLVRGMQIISTLTAFHTSVDNDVTFDPVAGSEVSIGPTDRWGAALWSRLHWRWLDLNGSGTYTYAVAGHDALGGRIRGGAPLPSLPALVARVDAAIDAPVGQWRGIPIRIRGGVVAGIRSAPPMLTVSSYPTYILDAAAGVRVGPVTLDVSLRNVFDLRNRDTQYEYRSTFVPGTPASDAPALHFTAGAPRTLVVSLTLHV